MAATNQQQWTSKLGNKYDLAWINRQEDSARRELKRLRSLKDRGNNLCADCGRPDNTWASVTHGVFLCITCSDVHRSVGTHLTKVKGCTGTYLWGPDELKKMQERGNSVADILYGSKKVAPEASKDEKQQFVKEKYKVEKSLDLLPLTSEASAKAHVVDQRESTAQGKLSSVPTLLTSMPNRGDLQPIAKNVVVPDNLFEELFKDWSPPIEPEAISQKIEVPLACSCEGNKYGNSAAASQPTLNVKARSPWGTLGDVDDIFAELNSINMTVR